MKHIQFLFILNIRNDLIGTIHAIQMFNNQLFSLLSESLVMALSIIFSPSLGT